ncbi:MAG TPA: DUF1801 domain-containing protein [Bacillota bacterium]|jgi:uncharacterized protein YdhG (YjbR/CyaY superfamily)|nr:DUF1801 domain-containing protein [Bacillota bacterium]
MQYDVKSPEEYLETLENDWRKDKLLEVRRLIMQHGPELEESIKYKMLSYGTEQGDVFALNAQKGYVSLYVGNISKIPNASALLKPFNTGKGCIRIRKSIDISSTGLEEFIGAAVALWRSGGAPEGGVSLC